jgi:enamine deaminase RidA (YjgF/YER057c/UK114 family)
MENIVKANVYLTDMKNFDGMNEAYREYFGGGWIPVCANARS